MQSLVVYFSFLHIMLLDWLWLHVVQEVLLSLSLALSLCWKPNLIYSWKLAYNPYVQKDHPFYCWIFFCNRVNSQGSSEGVALLCSLIDAVYFITSICRLQWCRAILCPSESHYNSLAFLIAGTASNVVTYLARWANLLIVLLF